MTLTKNMLSIHVTIAALLIAALSFSAVSAQVSQQWVARYGSPGTGQDYAKFVRTAPNGDVYVAGYVGTDYRRDIVMVKYNSNGVFQWDCFYDHDPWGGEFDEPNAMTVDENGYAYIAGRAGGGGSFDNEIVTIKFTPDGDTSWVRIYEGPDYGDDQAFDMVLDDEGNVYVTGWSDGGSGFGFDMVTIKYDSVGVQRWVVRYNGGTNYFDSGEGIDIGNDGYIYVTGTTGVADTLLDFVTIKYSPLGHEEWVRIFDAPTGKRDEAVDIVVDESNNVTVLGWTTGSSTNYRDYGTVKYNSNGDLEWSEIYNGPDNGPDDPEAIVADGAGNIYVTGNSRPTVGSSNDIVTIKYDGDTGAELWTAVYDNPYNGYDHPVGMDIDDDANIYIAGTSSGGPGAYDYVTLKYDSSGTQQWVMFYDNEINSMDDAQDITVDNEGNVYITGGSFLSSSYYDLLTVKYGPEIEAPVEIEMIPDNPPVTVNPGGYFTFTGIITNNTQYSIVGDVWVMLGLPDGSRYGPINRFDNIPLNPGQSITVNNIRQDIPTFAPLGMYDYIAYAGLWPSIKVDSASFGFEVVPPLSGSNDNWDLHGWFEDNSGQFPHITELSGNYPNPFNAQTTIELSLAEDGNVEISVYNIAGQKIETLVDGHLSAGEHQVNWNAEGYASGIYFYKLKTGNEVITKRMVLLK